MGRWFEKIIKNKKQRRLRLGVARRERERKRERERERKRGREGETKEIHTNPYTNLHQSNTKLNVIASTGCSTL